MYNLNILFWNYFLSQAPPDQISWYLSCSIGDAVGINRHFKEKNTDSHFSIYLGGTSSAQAQQIPVSMYVAETVQHSDSSQVNGL